MKTEFSKKELKRKKKPRIDYGFLFVLVIILALGTLMIFSASYPYAQAHYGDSAYYIKKQLIFLSIGIIVMYFSSRLSPEFIKKISKAFYIV